MEICNRSWGRPDDTSDSNHPPLIHRTPASSVPLCGASCCKSNAPSRTNCACTWSRWGRVTNSDERTLTWKEIHSVKTKISPEIFVGGWKYSLSKWSLCHLREGVQYMFFAAKLLSVNAIGHSLTIIQSKCTISSPLQSCLSLSSGPSCIKSWYLWLGQMRRLVWKEWILILKK